MAKPIKLRKGQDFTFKTASGGGGETKYPWDQWFNGDLLMLEQSEGPKDDKGTVVEDTISEKRDFEVDINGMAPKLKTAARRRYKVVQISRLDADGKKLQDALIIRARDMTPDERAAEDLLRAEEKVALAEKKAANKAAASTNGTPSTAPEAAPQPAV